MGQAFGTRIGSAPFSIRILALSGKLSVVTDHGADVYAAAGGIKRRDIKILTGR